jgi:hypothetical protein
MAKKWWQLERRPPGPWERRLERLFTGEPLPKGASRLERLRFVRRVSGRSKLLYLPVGIIAAAFDSSTWVTAAVGVFVLLSIANFLSLTQKIKRAETAERETR